MSLKHPHPWTARFEAVVKAPRLDGKRGTRAVEYWLVLDARGFIVADGLDETTAREIAAAVNGRAALSAVLRDMAKDCEAAWEGTPLRRALAKYFARLREIAGAGENLYGKGVGR